jgi:hypothetical protein
MAIPAAFPDGPRNLAILGRSISLINFPRLFNFAIFTNGFLSAASPQWLA